MKYALRLVVSLALAVPLCAEYPPAYGCPRSGCSSRGAQEVVLGYFTKSDLSSWGKLLIMAVIGLIIAGLVNIFVRNSLMDFVISVVGVLIFVGLTAYDSQKIKRMLMMQADMGETAQKVALMGALSLYLDFINLFLYLLRLFGRER